MRVNLLITVHNENMLEFYDRNSDLSPLNDDANHLYLLASWFCMVTDAERRNMLYGLYFQNLKYCMYKYGSKDGVWNFLQLIL